MALTPGTRLGVYEVTTRIGAGGMGEVYRARDTKLDRDVAIKILPEVFAHDADRLERFTREAKTLASLNHPHIAGIYGLEERDGVSALVMELVEGEDLSLRVARGAIPLDEALPIAKQIAEALEAAHEQGIIHRDLKPANIKVRQDGTVKVLDFGLAKAMAPAGASVANALNSPTVALYATEAGVILGTAAYMSPEQARGKAVDQKADIWAFGCVLYEMLCGARAFKGDEISDVLAEVIKSEPDWRALPNQTPPAIHRLLRRCLVKERKARLSDASAARLDIEEALGAQGELVSTTGRRFAALPMVLALAATALFAALATWLVTRSAPAVSASVTRFTIASPPALSVTGGVAVAPDGSFIVYHSRGRLAVRRLDRLDVAPLTAGVANGAFMPFISPDSRWIGYAEGFVLKKMAASGGAPIALAQLPGLPFGASWVDDKTVITATNNGTTGLLRVSAGGGEPSVLTTVDRAHGEQGHWFPSVLPGGRAVLFTIAAVQPSASKIALLDLQTGQRTTLIQGGSDARYMTSGHLVYATGKGISAVRFDLARRVVVGDAVPVVEGGAVSSNGEMNAAVTSAGTLVYVLGVSGAEPLRSLVWVDRQGHETPIPAPPRGYVSPRLSPDGTRVAVDIRDEENDIWIWEFERQALTRLTFDPAIDRGPVWTPDGRRLIFASSRTGAFDLYERAADGTGADVQLTASANSQYASAITPDGASVIGYEVRTRTAFDIVRFALGGRAGRPAGMLREDGLIETPFDERNGEVSPDGRFLAYQSNESGQPEIYVRPYPQVMNGRWQVSTGGGSQPGWAHDGRELFYLDRAHQLMAVPVETTGTTFRAGAAAVLLTTAYASPYAWRAYDVSSDGRRFLMVKNNAGETQAPAPSIVVVENWFEELKRLLPAK